MKDSNIFSAQCPNQSKIKTIFLHVTKQCNLSCKYCYFSANKAQANELSTNELKTILKDIPNVLPQNIVFTGGEPLLRADIWDLLLEIKKIDSDRKIKISLNTNGHLIDQNAANLLANLVDEVRLSLDALAPINDSLRGKGNFKAVFHAISILRDSGVSPKILVTVTSVNLPELDDLVEGLLNNGVKKINFNIFRPIGRGKKHQEYQVAREDVYRKLIQIKQLFGNQSLSYAHESNKVQSHCGVGNYLNILPNGDVFPCHVFFQDEFLLGNVRQKSLSMIYQHSIVERLKLLNFTKLVSLEPKLSQLTASNACMGEIYADSSELQIWRQEIRFSENKPD